jgi:hemerythrin
MQQLGMDSLQWSESHAVFVPEIDDEHKEIFEALSNLQQFLADEGPAAELRRLTRLLAGSIAWHFAHEERLMRAARYGSTAWHKMLHESARKRVGQFVLRIERGEKEAGTALVEYLTFWLHDHTRLADRMLGAFLRNHRRGMYKLTFRAGTKPAEAGAWVDSRGEKFDPLRQS